MEEASTMPVTSDKQSQIIDLVRHYGRACDEGSGAAEALGEVEAALEAVLSDVDGALSTMLGKIEAVLATASSRRAGYAGCFSDRELDALILAAGELRDGGETEGLSSVQIAALDRAAQLHRDRFAVDDQ
jgi:hypothetical protein